MRKSTSGFTIVELLIIVIVIAILAVIGTVAYNKIHEKAYDAKVDATLNQMQKSFSPLYYRR